MTEPNEMIKSQAVCIIPPNHIVNYAYNDDLRVEYMGHAVKGTSNTTEKWTIRKYTYTANKQVETERMAYNVSWNDRATATYS